MSQKPLKKIAILCAVLAGCAPTAQITVRVLDDSGTPVSNANVAASISTAIKPGWGWGAGLPNTISGQSDPEGQCKLSGTGNGGSVAVSVAKDGYYTSSGYELIFTGQDGAIFRRWLPYNSVIDVVLRKVGKPIPMYAKRVRELQVPNNGDPVGYDLIVGDWVAPHGRGESADLLVSFTSKPEVEYTTMYGSSPRLHILRDYTLALSFTGEGDGVIPFAVPHMSGRSALRLPPIAPEGGYSSIVSKRVYQEEGMPVHTDIQADQNYFIRVRSTKDVAGKNDTSLYGKIYGDFRFDHQGTITFTYYLNPTPNDRNVEFDPKRNLLKDLSPHEEVREP